MVTALLILAAVVVMGLIVAVFAQMCDSLPLWLFHSVCDTLPALLKLLAAIITEIGRQNE